MRSENLLQQRRARSRQAHNEDWIRCIAAAACALRKKRCVADLPLHLQPLRYCVGLVLQFVFLQGVAAQVKIGRRREVFAVLIVLAEREADVDTIFDRRRGQ